MDHNRAARSSSSGARAQVESATLIYLQVRKLALSHGRMHPSDQVPYGKDDVNIPLLAFVSITYQLLLLCFKKKCRRTGPTQKRAHDDLQYMYIEEDMIHD